MLTTILWMGLAASLFVMLEMTARHISREQPGLTTPARERRGAALLALIAGSFCAFGLLLNRSPISSLVFFGVPAVVRLRLARRLERVAGDAGT